MAASAYTGPQADLSDAAPGQEDVQALSRRYDSLLRRRAPWDSAWQSLADHFLPTRCRLNPQADAAEEGPMLNRGLVDATGILAMRTLAAGLQGGLTSPARPWFRLSLDDTDLARSRAGQAWLDEVATRMRAVFQRSNFYNAMHTLYGELGTFGTAFVFELADPQHGFRFVPLCAGEYALDCDAMRRVDTVFRRSGMTLRQIVQDFGTAALPETLREAARRSPDDRRNVFRPCTSAKTPCKVSTIPPACPWPLCTGLKGATATAMPCGFLAFGHSPALARAGMWQATMCMDARPQWTPCQTAACCNKWGLPRSRPSTRPLTRP